jgi:hypothetical protein
LRNEAYAISRPHPTRRSGAGNAREKQHTVVTEHRGPLAGKRVVRGLEAQCRAHYGL